MWKSFLSLFGGENSSQHHNEDTVGGSLSGQVERDQRELNDVHGELAALEEELTRCNLAIVRATRGERQIMEGWEQLVMGTYDPVEFPALEIECTSNQAGLQEPMFRLVEGALESVRLPRKQWRRERREMRQASSKNAMKNHQLDEDDDDPMSSSSSSHQEGEENSAPFIAQVTVDIKPASSSGKALPISGDDEPLILDLQRLTADSFVGGLDEFKGWLGYKRVWNARDELTNRDCLKSLTSSIVEAREELEDKLFNLRLKMMQIRALEVNVCHDLVRAEGETEHGEMLVMPPVPLSAGREDEMVIQ